MKIKVIIKKQSIAVFMKFQRKEIGTALINEVEGSKISKYSGIDFGVYKDYRLDILCQFI